MDDRPTTRTIDVRELGGLLQARRQARGLSLRQLQGELQDALTASALWRIEHGATPEPRNVSLLAHWLDLPLDQIGWPGEISQTKRLDTPDAIEVHLRADKKLSPDVAMALAKTVRRLYEDIVNDQIAFKRPPSAPHE